MQKTLLALIPLLALLPAWAQAEPPPLTLTASLEPSVPEGQPVVLALALHNGGTERLTIGGSAFEPSSFRITVTNGTGRTVPRTALGGRVLTPPTSVYANWTVIIGPGQTRQYRFNLARLFDLSRAGGYIVSVSRTVAPWLFFVPPPVPGQPTPPGQIALVLRPLKFRMVADVAAESGPTAPAPPPGRRAFLYMASQYSPGVSRYRVGGDGSVSFAFDPGAPGAGTPPPAPSLGSGPGALVATPDGHYLYASNSGGTVSQYRIGDDGVLSPLSPPTVPAPKSPSPFLMDPKGRFLFPGAPYAIGADGRLTVTTPAPSEVWPQDREHNVVPGVGAIDPTGTFLYVCNGLTYGYRLSPDGRVTALPVPTTGAAGPNGRDNAVALSPSGKFAFIGVSKENASAYFDLVVPMRVAEDGTLTPIPGGAQTLQAPPHPKGFAPYQCNTLAVDPTGRFLVVVNPGYLDCFRIGADGSLTPLGMTERKGDLDAVFFLPGSQIAYVHNRNPSSLLAFRLDDERGLVPMGLDMPDGVPFDASITQAAAPTPRTWGQTSGGLTISARLPADVLPSSGPVTLTLVLRNVTSYPVRLGTAGADMASFRLSVVGPQRRSPGVLRGGGEPAAAAVPLLAAGHDLLDAPGPVAAPLVLPPGGERQYQFVLSRLADLTVAGNYTVQVSRALPDGTEVASPVLHFLLDGSFNGINRNDNERELDVL